MAEEVKGEKHWYVVSTYNGLEETVKRNILSRVENKALCNTRL